MSEYKQTNTNVVVIEGRLTREPDMRKAGETDIAVLSVAYSLNYKKDGEWVDKSGFVDVKAWKYLADKCADLHKGDPVIITGKLDFESWQTKDHENRSKVIITASKIGFLTKSEERMNGVPVGKDVVDNPVVIDDDVPF